MGYNGWKNYETWNVALWMYNDELLYNIAGMVASMKDDYNAFASIMLNDFQSDMTPDGVRWDDPSLDIEALDMAIMEVVE
jgi:hypothetical protein